MRCPPPVSEKSALKNWLPKMLWKMSIGVSQEWKRRTYCDCCPGEEDECHNRDCLHRLTVFLEESAVSLDYEVESLSFVSLSAKA